MKKSFILTAAIAAVFVFATVIPARAQESFYKGKAVRIIVATSAGGGFDTYTRAIARHLGKHIPGNPTIIVENMPGAGHRIGANHVYRVAKSEEARQLIQVGIQDPSEYYRPYVLPPGTPKDRVQTLRKAFHDTMKDPELLEDAKRSKLDIEHVTAEELERNVAGLFKLNPSLLAKLKEIFTTK